MDLATRRARLENHWQDASDTEGAHEFYHDDCVIEFPQTGDRFVGLETLKVLRRSHPAVVSGKLRCIRCRGDLWIAENSTRCEGGPAQFTVNIVEFRGEKVARESIYISEGWPRSAWLALAPLAATDTPDRQRAG